MYVVEECKLEGAHVFCCGIIWQKSRCNALCSILYIRIIFFGFRKAHSDVDFVLHIIPVNKHLRKVLRFMQTRYKALV
jgi:hypothetical protein